MLAPLVRKHLALALLLTLLCSWFAHSVSQVVMPVAQESALLAEEATADYHAKSTGDHFHSAGSADHVHDTLQLPLNIELSAVREADGIWPWRTSYLYPTPSRLDRPPSRLI
ncbi:MAG: hypothetical protein ACPG4U_13195 [Pseudomonadales bacterium]